MAYTTTTVKRDLKRTWCCELCVSMNHVLFLTLSIKTHGSGNVQVKTWIDYNCVVFNLNSFIHYQMQTLGALTAHSICILYNKAPKGEQSPHLA